MSKKLIVLHHISRATNNTKIRSRGLIKGLKPSGYGTKPTLEAVYMYHPKNGQVLSDFINAGNDFDVWEVRIPTDSPLVEKLVADEDAIKFAGVASDDWESSLDKFGTCALIDNIPPSMVTLVFRADFNRTYKRLPEKLIN